MLLVLLSMIHWCMIKMFGFIICKQNIIACSSIKPSELYWIKSTINLNSYFGICISKLTFWNETPHFLPSYEFLMNKINSLPTFFVYFTHITGCKLPFMLTLRKCKNLALYSIEDANEKCLMYIKYKTYLWKVHLTLIQRWACHTVSLCLGIFTKILIGLQ